MITRSKAVAFNASLLTEDNSPAPSVSDHSSQDSTYRLPDLISDFDSDSESSFASDLSSTFSNMTFDRAYAFNIIPELNGRSNINLFLDQCDSIYDEFGDNCGPSLISIMKSKIPDTLWVSVRGCTTYEDLKEKLIRKFADDTPISMMLTSLVTLNQSKFEDLKCFTDRAQMIFDKLVLLTESFLNLKTEDSESTALVKTLFKNFLLDFFVKGINDDKLRQLVLSNNFNDFNKAADYAKCMEVVFKSYDSHTPAPYKTDSNITNQIRNQKQCNFCKMIGHFEKDCRKKQQIKNFKTSDEPRQGSSNQKQKLCNFCGIKGHWENNCRKKQSQVHTLNSKNQQVPSNLPPDILLAELVRHFNLK